MQISKINGKLVFALFVMGLIEVIGYLIIGAPADWFWVFGLFFGGTCIAEVLAFLGILG